VVFNHKTLDVSIRITLFDCISYYFIIN